MNIVQIVDDFLLSRVAHPRFIGEGYSTVSNIALNHSIDLEIARSCVKELEAQNFLVSTGKTSQEGDELFIGTVELAVERERRLHSKTMRSQFLLKQEHYQLSDLIVAILMDPEIENKNMPAGFLGQSSVLAIQEIEIYLFRFTIDEIKKSIDDLVSDGLVRLDGTKIFWGKTRGICLTTKGRVYYKSDVCPIFKLDENTSILRIIFKKSIGIFFAWQSDFNPSRTKISKVLERIEKNNEEFALRAPVKVVLATDAGDGAVRIDQQLIDKISAADFFIGDVTPIVKYKNKLIPNPNVLIESGYALVHKKPNQIYLLEEKRSNDDIDGDESSFSNFPFDIFVAKRITFSKSDELEKRLAMDLEVAFKENGLILKEKQSNES